MSSSQNMPLTPGKRLQVVRKEHRWSQEQVSEQIGVDARTYSRWEQGRYVPGLRQLRRLCDVFGLSPEELGFDVEQ